MPMCISTHKSASRRTGFTLVELLVVVVVIGIVAGLLLAGFRTAFTKSRNTVAARQLATISQAIETFNTDHGYFPPILTEDTTGNRVYRPETSLRGRDMLEALRDARFSSEYTLAVYLLGLGDTDGNGTPDQQEDDGLAGAGIKSPGPDRFWGLKIDSGSGLTPNTGRGGYVVTTGRSYGPYISLSVAEDLIERDPDTGLYRFLDPWGNPVRYYANWPIERQDGEKTIGLTPIELRSREAVQGQVANGGDPIWDRDYNVMNAKYALLSAGESGEVDAQGNDLARFGDISNPNQIFNPTTLSEADLKQLLTDLDTNVRLIP